MRNMIPNKEGKTTNRLNEFLFTTILAVALLNLPAIAFSQNEDIENLVKRLSGEGAPPPTRPQELSSAYKRVIEALIPGLASSQSREIERADNVLKKMCWHAGRPGAEAERLAVSKALAEKLGKDVLMQASRYVVRQLGLIGDKEAVPALARLLKSRDALLREETRRALQRIPSEAASIALRKAIPGAKGDFRIALVISLGARRDAGSVDLLLKEARKEDEGLRTAAVEALGRIGDARATPLIEAAMKRGFQRARQRAANALLILADNLATKGEKDAANRIRRRIQKATTPQR